MRTLQMGKTKTKFGDKHDYAVTTGCLFVLVCKILAWSSSARNGFLIKQVTPACLAFTTFSIDGSAVIMMKGIFAYCLSDLTFSSKTCPLIGSMFQSEITKLKCFSDIWASAASPSAASSIFLNPNCIKSFRTTLLTAPLSSTIRMLQK